MIEHLVEIDKRLERVEGLIISGNIEARETKPNKEPPKADFDIDAFTDI